MKILVIGGRSFIGRPLVTRLLKGNYSVIIGASDKSNVSNCINRHESIYLNLFDEDSIRNVISVHKPNVIFFLASVRGDGSHVTKPILDANCVGLNSVMEACVSVGIRPKIIFSSSMGVYNYDRPEYLPVDEKHPLTAYDFYGLTKIIGEQLCDFYSNHYGFSTYILRIPGVFGKGKNKGLIYNCLKYAGTEKIITIPKKLFIRDFISVDDVVLALYNLVDYSGDSNVFNIGSGTGVSLQDIVKLSEEITGEKIQISYDNSIVESSFYLDITKASDAINFIPTEFKKSLSDFWYSI